MSEKKSYFYVFMEEKSSSETERIVKNAFNRFKKAHCKDSEVTILAPEDEMFEELRTKFEVMKTPAFVISDEPYTPEGDDNPYIRFDRDFIDRQLDKGLNHVISDFHYLLKDEDILRVGEKRARVELWDYFGIVWSEIKDFVSLKLG